MDLLLIPGFWLDASSWDEVTPALVAAGHTVHAITLPGLETSRADRSSVTLQQQIDAVVERVDAIDGPVVLVGHSGGGNVAYGAADARPDRVARIVYVDSLPPADGGVINDELPAENGLVPLPEWSAYENELADMTEEQRDAFRARAIPLPARVASDPIKLTDERRRAVPATIIATTMLEADYRAFLDPEHPWHAVVAEIVHVEDVSYIDLPTSHWPQFTKPAELGAAIVGAVG